MTTPFNILNTALLQASLAADAFLSAEGPTPLRWVYDIRWLMKESGIPEDLQRKFEKDCDTYRYRYATGQEKATLRTREALAKIIRGLGNGGNWDRMMEAGRNNNLPWIVSPLFHGKSKAYRDAHTRYSENPDLLSTDMRAGKLTPAELEAVFALANETSLLPIYTRDYLAPTFDLFAIMLKIAAEYEEEDYDWTNPVSPFIQSATELFYSMERNSEFGWVEKNSAPICRAEIFIDVKRKADLDQTWLKRLYSALQKSGRNAIDVFLYLDDRFCADRPPPGITSVHWQAAIRLLEIGLEEPDIARALVFRDVTNLLERAEEFRKFLEHFSEQSSFRPHTAYTEGKASEEELAAAFLHVKKIYRERNYPPEFFPDYPRFKIHFKLALNEVLSKQRIFSFEQLAKDIKEMGPGLHGVDANVFDSLTLFVDGKWKINRRQISPIRWGLLKGDAVLNRAFFQNVNMNTTPQQVETAILLLHAGYPLTGKVFKTFCQYDRHRQDKLVASVPKRAKELMRGASPGLFFDDAKEIMAITEALNGRAPTQREMLWILQQAHIAPKSPDVFLKSFHFTATTQEIVHGRVHLGVLEEYVSVLRDIGTPERLHTWLTGWIKQAKSGKWRKDRGILKSALKIYGDPLDEGNSVNFLETLLKTASNNLDITKGFSETGILLAAYTWYHHATPHMREAILAFHKSAPAENVVEALYALIDFYGDMFHESFRKFFGLKPPLYWKFFKQAEGRLQKEREKIDLKKGSAVKITLLPSRNDLDAFFGHMADNCLAREKGYALHALSNPHFAPYRLLLNGQWRGMVLTYTFFEGADKVLVVSGIDPQTDVHLNPKEFMDGIQAGFEKVARSGGYSLVVIPREPVGQSSRRAFLHPEIQDRYKKPFTASIPISFPMKADKQFYTTHQNFLILADLRKGTPLDLSTFRP